MKRTINIVIAVFLIATAGCAEMRETTQLMSVALVELFRLPIYCMQLPFQLLQNMGPVINASVRTAANLAPLLLFIERRVPQDSMLARSDNPGSWGGRMAEALASEPAALMDVLEEETERGAPCRFFLVDSRLLEIRSVRGLFEEWLPGAAAHCVSVDAGAIFTDPERFIEACRRMGERGDSLFALTAFNRRIAALAGCTGSGLPLDPADRALLVHWERMLREAGEDARREG